MTRIKLTLSIACVCILAVLQSANAQNRRSNFRVDAPLSQQGYKIIDEISTTGVSPWGTGIDSTWEGYSVGYDATNADGCLNFPPGTFTGKFALIFRGGCEFGAKALAAQNAGAKGVILVNNLLGVAGMAAGAVGAQVIIPVVMVTTTDGKAMRDAIVAGTNVTVSLTDWRFNPTANPIDIGFMNDGPVLPLGRAIPSHQVSTASGNLDDAFRVFAGARFYNFGPAPWDGLFQEGIRSYRPSLVSGAFTPVDTNAVLWNFATGATQVDSIITIAIDTLSGVVQGFDMNDAAIGTYRIQNAMEVDSTLVETGLSTLNNVWTYDFAINDFKYSKAEYDFVNNKPVVNSYVNVANASEWGPILYIRNNGYIATKAEVVIMRDVITDSVFTGQEVACKLYKWDDLDANGAIDTTQELEEVGFGAYALSTEVVPITGLPLSINLENSVSTNTPILLEAGNKYWLTMTANGGTGGFAIGTDYYSDYSANLAFGFSEGNPLRTQGSLFGGGFANAGSPSIALVTAPRPVVVPNAVADVKNLNGEVKVYPNPANNVVNVDLKLQAAAKNINITILDITGKVISSIAKQNVTTGTFSYNTSALVNGTYFVRVATELGNTEVKFVVSK